jgi:tRNA threonylcarbamoyladenosine biosynthesis protein TsaE
VHSPTFTLVNEYPGGRLPLFHLDLYRLDTSGQIHGAGLDEYLQPDGVAVIEWAERLGGDALSASAVRRVAIEVLGETERRITYEDSGA